MLHCVLFSNLCNGLNMILHNSLFMSIKLVLKNVIVYFVGLGDKVLLGPQVSPGTELRFKCPLAWVASCT